MVNGPEPRLVVESDPDPEINRFLEDQLYEFNVQTSGTTDDKLLAILLRGPDGEVVGGAYGWTWGGTCYVRSLFLPESMRNRGHDARIMRTLEQEAVARGCEQIMLQTHSFQAPAFYRKLGFTVIGVVDDYPRGHQYLTMLKRLPVNIPLPAERDPGRCE
jgi:GNAT superfamily N-acetyltransferase